MRLFKAITLICILFAIADRSNAEAPSPPLQAAGYSLVFFDDFTNLNLAPDGISGAFPWYRGVWYQPIPKPFNVSAGTEGLTLSWTSGQNPPNTAISSCSQDGLHCRSFRYGYFEATMKWDVVPGAAPDFWLLPVQNVWKEKETGELDIFEGQGDPYNAHRYFGTIHDWVLSNGVSTDIANNCCQNFALLPNADFSQWHKYGVLWVQGKVTWYFDDQPIITAPTYPVFDQQFYYVMIGIHEAYKWKTGSLTNVTATKLNLVVDSIKVWQK